MPHRQKTGLAHLPFGSTHLPLPTSGKENICMGYDFTDFLKHLVDNWNPCFKKCWEISNNCIFEFLSYTAESDLRAKSVNTDFIVKIDFSPFLMQGEEVSKNQWHYFLKFSMGNFISTAFWQSVSLTLFYMGFWRYINTLRGGVKKAIPY